MAANLCGTLVSQPCGAGSVVWFMGGAGRLLAAQVGTEDGYFRFVFAYQMSFGATSEGLTTTLRSKHKM